VTDEVCEVVITAPNAGWLAQFVRDLIEQRLCAAGHIAPIRSIYTWQSNIEDRPEVRAILHTRLNLVSAIVEQTTTKHPYAVPCVVATPIVAANLAYAQWILDETQRPAEPTIDPVEGDGP